MSGGGEMTEEGWTIADLKGELISQGVDFDDIMFIDIYRQLKCESVEEAAKNIVEGMR